MLTPANHNHPNGLTNDEAAALVGLLPTLGGDHIIACRMDPEDGLCAQVIEGGRGVRGAVMRLNGRLGVLDFLNAGLGASGPHETIEDLVAALALALAPRGVHH